ncbi:hypothetical protein QM012_003395 [Aureobasidium pullulans]|uniref:Aminoglycoside phosphotransferase domain-containing protein n=1 Tax=Aureobasidium pullulans TaxID=5580 RepID=A0ABR0T9H1_AURPU
MFREMNPRHVDSITTPDQKILNVGTSRICIRVPSSEAPPSESLASWQDGYSVIHVLLRDTLSFESLELDHQLIHEAGSANAVWTLGNTAVCKVNPWKEGYELEADTLAYISTEFPSIPITEVIYTWIDKPINRSFLITKRIHARTIDQAWADLSHQQRLNLANEVAHYTALVATKTSNIYQTVSGCGVRFGPGPDYPFDSPIHHWFPRTVGPMPAVEYRAYLQSLSSKPFPEFDDDLVLVHDDVGPTNVLVSDDGDSVAAIIDWANVAYKPRFWVCTVLYAVGGFIMEDERIPEAERSDWAKMLAAALQAQGFHECKDQYRAWRKEVADCDTEKDLAEWSKVQVNPS